MLPVEEVEAAPAEHKRLFERQMQSTSRVIGIMRYVAMVLAIVCGAMLAVVFAVSSHMPSEKRLILGTVVGTVVFCLVAALIALRRDPNTTIVLAGVVNFASGLCLGLSMWYA